MSGVSGSIFFGKGVSPISFFKGGHGIRNYVGFDDYTNGF